MGYLRLALLIAFVWTATGQTLPAGRAQDLDFVANQVTKLHPNFFFQSSPAAFQQAVADLQTKGAAMTDAEFNVGLASLLTTAGDGHTLIYLIGAQASAAGFKTFPITFVWLDDGVYVFSASAAYSRARGTRLVAVAGTPIDQVVQRLSTVISHGNDQWLHFYVPQYLAVQQVLQGLHVAPVAGTTLLTFQTGAGELFSLDVAPGTQPQLPAIDSSEGPVPDYLRNTSQFYWFRYSAENRLLYFKYNLCADDPANPMAQFAPSLLSTLDKNPVDTLVFDLRGNTGGDDSVIAPLALGLVQRLPVLAANPKFRFYDVIDKGTFSSGVDIAMGLKAPIPAEYGLNVDLPKLTTVIGEGTGGPSEGYGEVKQFTLPSSKLVGQYSTRFFPAPAGIAPAPSFLPDVAISTRSTDFFARHDPVMAAILSRAGGAPAAPSGSAIVVNGASFRVDQGVSPGSIAAVFGNFGIVPDEVRIEGAAAKVISGNPTQANFIVPIDVTPGLRTVSVRASGKEVAAGKVTLTAGGPAIFVLNGADPSQPGAVENQDYAVNSSGKPAAAASILQIFATGASPTDSALFVTVYLGGIPAEVTYSGPSGYPGLWQINAKIPAGVVGQVPLFLAYHNLVSNAVTVWVK
jgi:uncharacterized protein (TIGR03437 family)